MGSTDAPRSAASQPLNQVATATSSGTGTATFTFPSPPQGTWWTGTISCATANSGAVFTAVVGSTGGGQSGGGTSWGSWGGNSVYGPIQCYAQQQLIITATLLAANTLYELTWLGTSDPGDSVAAIWPDANSTALTAQISGTVPISGNVTTLQGSVTNAGDIDQIILEVGITSLPNTSTTVSVYQAYTGFQLLWAGTLAPTSITLTNVTQGMSWVIDKPYLSNGGNNLIGTSGAGFLVPLQAAQGDQISAYVAGSGSGTGELVVWGQTHSASIAVTPVPNQSFDVVTSGGLLQKYLTITPITSGTFLASPGTGYAYRIHSVTVGVTTSFATQFPSSSALGLTTISGNLNGSIIVWTAGWNGPLTTLLNGLLVPGAIYYVAGGMTASVYVVVNYDIVASPNVI